MYVHTKNEVFAEMCTFIHRSTMYRIKCSVQNKCMADVSVAHVHFLKTNNNQKLLGLLSSSTAVIEPLAWDS